MRYVNRDPEGRYTLTKEIICDPHHSVVLQWVRLEGHRGVAAAAEGVCAAGAASGRRRRGQLGAGGGCGRAQDAAGVEERVVAGDGRELRVFARELRLCGRERRLAGPEGELPDGLGVWLGHDGNIAMMGELNLGAAGDDGSRDFTVAIGLGQGQHTALQKTVSALAEPYRRAPRAVYRAVAPGGESRVAGGEVVRRREADAGQPQRAAGA